MGKHNWQGEYRPLVAVTDIHGVTTVHPFERGVVEFIHESTQRLDSLDNAGVKMAKAGELLLDRINALADALGYEWVPESTVKAHFAEMQDLE